MARTKTDNPTIIIPPLDSDPDPGNRQPARGRRIAFRVATVFALLALAPLIVIGLAELVLMWLSGETVLGIVDDPSLTPGEIDLHRTHFLATGLIALAYVPNLLVQFRRPARRLASMQLLAVVPVAGAVIYGLTGTLAEWLAEEVVILVPTMVVAALHPRASELVRRPTFDATMVATALVGVVPWLVYAVQHAILQVQNHPTDSHAELEHLATMAMVGLAIAAAATLGASRNDGWRVPAGTAVAISLVLGIHGLVFPDTPSSLHPVAAIALLAWAVVYGAMAFRRANAVHAG